MEIRTDDFNAVIKEIIVAHKFKYDRGTTYGYHKGRKSWGLVYILSGELEYKFSDGRGIRVGRGDMFILKPTDAYNILCTEECLHYTLNFKLSSSSVSGEAAKKLFLTDDIAIINQSSVANYHTDTLEELALIWSKKSAGYKMQAMALAYKLLYGFINSRALLLRTDKFEKIAPAKEYIEAHWNENITLSELALLCSMSTTHFRHLFTEIFNTSPLGYRDSIRLTYSKDYLADERYTVSEAAYKCGFPDVNYFSRFFKKHTGKSPTEYRQI
ncbi:MAG: helix-turn-helix transcriptional regulator [Ruminococcaceae bacterium]|nr:helix-turn-helix transcriptional regulator [Oscillospiraceae bacterium]